ncbi:hypothetical protein V6N13_004394 [Hibiscus sabdariffa]
MVANPSTSTSSAPTKDRLNAMFQWKFRRAVFGSTTRRCSGVSWLSSPTTFTRSSTCSETIRTCFIGATGKIAFGLAKTMGFT